METGAVIDIRKSVLFARVPERKRQREIYENFLLQVRAEYERESAAIRDKLQSGIERVQRELTEARAQLETLRAVRKDERAAVFENYRQRAIVDAALAQFDASSSSVH